LYPSILGSSSFHFWIRNEEDAVSRPLEYRTNIPFFIGANTPFQKEKTLHTFTCDARLLFMFLAATQPKGLAFAVGCEIS
jgi:hypothetical protein